MKDKDLELLKKELLGVEELVEEQPVEKTEDPEITTAPTADPESGASSSEDSSSDLADLKQELVTDPPKEYKHISLEDAKTAGTSKLSSIYPKVKIKKDSNGRINVTNIGTGESKSFLLDHKEINKNNRRLQSRD